MDTNIYSTPSRSGKVFPQCGGEHARADPLHSPLNNNPAAQHKEWMNPKRMVVAKGVCCSLPAVSATGGFGRAPAAKGVMMCMQTHWSREKERLTRAARGAG